MICIDELQHAVEYHFEFAAMVIELLHVQGSHVQQRYCSSLNVNHTISHHVRSRIDSQYDLVFYHQRARYEGNDLILEG